MRYWQQVAILFIACVTWIVTALIYGMPETAWEVVRPFLSSVTVTGIAVRIFDRWAWSWRIFHGTLTQRPNIKGVWKVTIVSTWRDQAGATVPPIEGYAQVDQSSDSFCLRIYTDKSSSKTIASAFELDQKVYRLAIVYENEPNIEIRQSGSPYHKGSAIFNIRGRYPQNFSGDYWTERKTTGTISLRDRRSGEINSYDDGSELYGNSNLMGKGLVSRTSS